MPAQSIFYDDAKFWMGALNTTTIGSITFDDNAFADAISLVDGTPVNTNFDGLIGSTNQSVADLGVSNNSPTVEANFTDNLIVNGDGIDFYIYVPGEVSYQLKYIKASVFR